MHRRFIALAVSMAVQGAALGAPLVHAHVDDHDGDHHGGAVVHSHFSGHASSHRRAPDGPRVAAPGAERAVYLQLFVAEAVASFDAPFVSGASFDLVAPREGPARRLRQVAHGHDPPFVRSRPSRAPPAFVS